MNLSLRERAVLDGILHRAIADDRVELKRLRTLASTYFDRPAGQGHDAQIETLVERIDIATVLLSVLVGR